jgi:uncharacterized circularly permuted ATP-grasp superfamily protein/uncharacterized alpha-E superfamily protein
VSAAQSVNRGAAPWSGTVLVGWGEVTLRSAGTETVGLLDGYRSLPSVHDEMVDRDGGLREQWIRVGHALDGLGYPELARRRGEAARLLANDGVDYQLSNVEPDGGVPARRWELDPVPVLLGSGQWAEIERGVIQRAELLNLVLADLYGERRLLRTGVLPPELVFGHPGFLREADGIRIPGGQQLFSCAVDLARDASGAWWALSDRTQTPSGFGYALENRLVTSRVFPSMYRDVQVHRLVPFFRTLRCALREAAPPSAEEPRIVVLTPGPWSGTAFEHAFLASYLGYSLVEGADLTVRDGRVWLRSLGRLEPVDVILRRVDSTWCDPLELRSDSLLGVPGLVEACRVGSVSVVNPLGSGVLENPGLLPLLPTLAKHLLGEPLQLASAPSWWCGDETGRKHVLAHLDRLVIKSITREPGAETLLGWECSAAQRDELRARIEARPYGWVGQESLDLATVPALTERGLHPQHVLTRAFLVARNDSYVAMPGGLARVAAPAKGALIANRGDTVYKDIWVAASEPEDTEGSWSRRDLAGRDGRLAATFPEATFPEATLTSRAAENLFWLGRYAERAEAQVRLLRVVGDRRTDFADRVSPAGTACVRTLLAALSRVSGARPGFGLHGAPGPASESAQAELVDAELAALMTDTARPGTLAFAVHRLRDAAYPVRDQLSGDTWLVLGALERELFGPAEPGGGPNSGRLARVLGSLLAFGGLTADMVRDQGWRFLDAGRALERALGVCTLLRATVVDSVGIGGGDVEPAAESLLLESVLSANESIITYRRRYRMDAQRDSVLELLLFDPDNPRSAMYQIDRLGTDLAAMADRDRAGRLTESERLVLEASTALRLADPTSLTAPAGDRTPGRTELAALLERLVRLLERTADAVDGEHFTHLLPQRPLAGSATQTQTQTQVQSDDAHLRLV